MNIKNLSIVVAAAVFLLGSECPMQNPNMNDNNSNSNSNSNNNSNGNSSGDGPFQLTIKIKGPANGEFARVYGVVNDGPQTHASLENRFPQSDFNVTLGGGETEVSQMFTYDKDTKVALVAVEADGGITSTPPPDTIETFPMQFVEWTGNAVGLPTGDGLSNPATLYLNMDADKTVEANFKTMTPIFVRAQSSGNLSDCNVIIHVDVDRYIIPPRPVDDGFGVAVRNLPAGVVFLWGYFRDGAVLSLELHDALDNGSHACDAGSPNPCFVFQQWTGDCQGGGKTCVMTYGSANEATVHIEPN